MKESKKDYAPNAENQMIQNQYYALSARRRGKDETNNYA